MTDDELIRMNMLIHGHNENVELLKLDEKLVDLAVMLASTDDYEQTDFKPVFLNPKIILKDSRVFLREKFVLHKIAYADEVGSTTKILKYVKESSHNEFIIVTEIGVVERLERDYKDKKFIHISERAVCKSMKYMINCILLRLVLGYHSG